MEANPLLANSGLPRFNAIEPEHVLPAVESVVAKVESDLASLEASLASGAAPTWESLVEPYMRLGDELEYAWGPVGHLLAVKNTPELREVYEQAQPKIVEMSLKIGQNRPIYDGLVAVRDSEAWAGFSDAQKRAVELYIRNAEHAGVALEGEAQERFLTLQHELSQLGLDFSNHVLDATKAFELLIEDAAETEGWPKTLRQITAQSYSQANEGAEASPEAGPWRVTLDPPTFSAFMQHHRGRAQREAVYRAFVTRASSGEFDNSQIIEDILVRSQEVAKLLGYQTYARLSLSKKMAGTVEAVASMTEQLRAASKPVADREFAELEAYAKAHGQAEPLRQWDTGFWSERIREERFEFTDDDLRPYFPMPRVLDGLFGLCERLFGMTVREVTNEPTVWHEDVRYYEVMGETGEVIAGFYLDPYSRPAEKRGGAWMNGCLNRRVEADGVRLPVVHLCCNGTPPVGDTPSLMSFREVETLYHEFGHGLQGMLTTQAVAGVAGLSGIEWDAIELASQFMENWCYEKPVLLGMTQHVETGEALPDDLYEKIVAARTYMAGSGFMRQLQFGITDMELYESYTPGGEETAHDVALRVARETSPLEPLPESRSLCAFGHLFGGGYGAGYYSYKWSEVLSADAFSAFEEAGLGDEQAVQTLGRRYRDTVLALGGGLHPMAVYRAFRGREPEVEALLRHNGLLEPAGG